MATRTIFWFRRDLRLADNPALCAAADAGDEVIGLYILDPHLIENAGSKRLSYLAASLRALDESMGGNLHVVAGNPRDVITDLVKKQGATEVHISQEYEPYGAARDEEIEKSGITLVRTGSPYAVAPGRVRKPSDGTPYKVYTPFYKAWSEHGWRKPISAPAKISWVKPGTADRAFPDYGPSLMPAGEAQAHLRWSAFKKKALNSYDEARNIPGIDGTSKLSHHLTWGEIHPRTLLAELGGSKAHEVYRKEIAWREFYADVLFHNPHTENDYYAPNFKKMKYNKPGKDFAAWCQGKTGYPFVDAAMRQLVTEGWMHNRTRMVVASFLVKDLHIEWQHGADFFMEHLIDFDVASNAHGWQWTAGCGTDASPYYRVFNPVDQGKRFDEAGDYIKKYVPELAHLSGDEVHEPWLYLNGYAHGYPEQIVDHKAERLESLARLEAIKEAKPLKPGA